MTRVVRSVLRAVSGIVLVVASRAGAADRYVTVGLDWTRASGAESCLERQDVVAAVDARLGRAVFGEAERADVRLVGHAQRNKDGSFSVQLVLTSSDGRALGQRQLNSTRSDCSTLDDSVALALAIMLDLTHSEVEFPVASLQQTKREERQKTPIRIPRDTEPKRAPWVFEVGSGVAVSYGWLPSAAAGIQLQAWLSPPRFWTVGLMATRFAAVDRGIAVATAGVSFRLQTLALLVCPLHHQAQNVEVSLCALERLALVRAEAFGFDENRATTEATLAAGALGSASWSFWGSLRAGAAVSVDVPWVQTAFVYQGADGEKAQVFRTHSSVESLAVTLSANF